MSCVIIVSSNSINRNDLILISKQIAVESLNAGKEKVFEPGFFGPSVTGKGRINFKNIKAMATELGGLIVR